MRKIFYFSLALVLSFVVSKSSFASHGMALVNPSFTVGATALTFTASSNAATCGGGPYWLQVELRCTAGQLTGTPPATMQTNLLNWAGPGVTYANFPWYNALLNVPNYNIASSWPDQCTTEPYHPVTIPYTGLCPGQTYFFSAREWVSGTNTVGPWTTPSSFVVPGVFVPLNFNVVASPTLFCSPGCSTLSVNSIAGGCGAGASVLWSPGGSTLNSVVVCPGATTTYSATVNTPCNTLTKTVQVTVVPAVSAAFTPVNSTGCTGVPVNFNHTGTAGVSHTWAATPAAGVTVTTVNSANPSMTFANAGVYTISHTVAIGSCTNVVTTNITIGAINPAFTVPTGTQCLQGNSFNFNATTAAGTHTYAFNPAAGAPPTGFTANYGPAVFTTPGTYTVTHTINNGGCVGTATRVVVVNPQPTGVLTPSNATCGLNNGSIVITNTSGAGQTVTGFSVNGTAIPTQTATGLGAGNYNVTMVNNFGCTVTLTTTIINSPVITALATTSINPTCGNNNGSITLGGVTGGTPTFSYNVNGGAYSTSPPLTNLGSGTYTIGVIDSKGCTFVKTVVLANAAGPTAITLTTSPATCLGTAGSMSITGVTGGSPAYTFSVNGVSTGSVTGALTAGTHTVLVRDLNGCTFQTTFNIGTVTGPTAGTVVTTNAACGNANGSATVTAVTGGLAPYQYSFNGGPFSTNNFVGSLTAGSYTVIVRDANSCTVAINYVVGNTGSPVSNIAGQTNVSCFGGTNGTFTVNTAGGTPGYSYTLTPGNITSGTGVYTNLAQGAYVVNVKDAAGCVTTVSVNITQPTALTLTLASVPPLCSGGSNGSITGTGGGGTSPYQFSLNGGPFQVGNTFTGVSSGVYNVTIRDNNNCTLTQSVQVTQPSGMTLTVNSSNANCTAANGTASVSVSGGSPAYTYNWSSGGGTAAQTNPLVAGTYTVTVTDVNSCTATAVAVINSTPGGTAVISGSVNPSCNGFTNGSMTAGFTGAMSAPISYSWSNGQNTQTATGLGAGTYTVTLTDAFGCTSSVAGTLSEPGALDIMTGTVAVSCFNGSNGSATAIYNGGGTPPLTYLWAPGGATTATSSNLPAGVYTVTVTDSKGCTAVASATVTQPTSVTVTSTVTAANCGQANGSATVSATGGTPAYSYTWSTSATGSTLGGVVAGTYTITVADAAGCITTAAATIPNTSGPTISLATQTNVSCFGGNNGIATTTVTGGATPYIYLWSNGQVTGTATNLQAGVYTATVTDNNGCISSTSVTITQPPALTVTASGTNPLCFNATNGTANAGVLGGTAGYNYAWVPSGSTVSNPTGLGPGNHIVTVTDANGCIATASVSLINPAQMSAAVTGTNVTCFGACNGMANATTSNAIGAVVYFWTGGPAPLTTQNITNLCPGTYSMVATDLNGCTASASVIITQPTQLTASITGIGNASCAGYNDGFATVAPAGGTPAYTYSWLPIGGSGSTANNLTAGTYTAVITDAMGCTANAIATVTQPAALQSTLTTANVTCNGLNNGTGNVAYSGGTGPYTFLWLPTLNNTSTVNNLPPGTHTIQITDNLGCITTQTALITQPAALTAVVSASNSNCTQANGNACVVAGGGAGGYTYQWTGNPLFTNSCINNVVAGSYTVTVTDANGCTASGVALINDIAGPSVVVTATTPVSCFGGSNGSANVSISGGVGTISILWSHLAQTVANVNNLPAGFHSITITDGAGCVASASVNITQPTLLVSAISNVTMVTCSGANNGTATMLVNGGTPAYTYTWTPSSQSSSVAVSMGPGIYTCAVSDANGCTTSQTVNISQPNPLQISSFSVTNLSCFNNNSGQVNTTIIGGSPAYSITWSPAQPANPIITNLPAGTYSLTVTDTKSCSVSGVYIVTQPTQLTSAATATPATCGNANGSATVTVNGGTPGYNYNWNTPTPQNTSVATGMASNTWSCIITDANGCIITQSVTVPNAPGPVLAAMNYTAPLCFGQQNGAMSITFTSGTAPYTFNWNNPSASTTQTVNGVGAGVYSATVTDAYGCTVSGVVNVIQPNQLLLNVSANQTICYGQSAQIFAAGSGGTTPYTYSWTPSTLVGGGPHAVNPTSSASYQVFLTDINNCTTSPKTIIVNVLPQLTATGYAVTKCDGAMASFSAQVASPGNGGPYTYNWSNGSTSSSINVQANYATTPNVYTLTISDGCSVPNAVALYTLDVNPLPSGTITADVTSGCAPLSVNFSAVGTSTTDVLNWSFGNGLGSGSPINNVYTDPGVYTVQLNITNQFGCKMEYVNQNYIQVFGVPVAEFFPTPQSATILDPGIHFTNTSTGASSYFWDFGDYNSPFNNTTAMHPDHVYELAGVYQVYLVAINDKGCMDTVMHLVEITPDYALYIPNVFTPDGNGLNDTFQPKGVGIDEDDYKMYIFDRWGEIIFTSDEFRKGWDGTVKGSTKLAEQGVYVYRILVKDLGGTVHEYIGHVTNLIRQKGVD
ncbi:MAG: gliding motility-associated C-terminal domain-containing protein [Bacteroidia bacterium]|nr:gliding motility-associated C-terminal domain-containing protein [Bacteroidia bacterium]